MKLKQSTFFSLLMTVLFVLHTTGCGSNKIKTTTATPSQKTLSGSMPRQAIKAPLQAASEPVPLPTTQPSGSAKSNTGTLIINKPTVKVGNTPKPTPHMPKRGVTKARVEQEFGPPNRKAGPVGSPPISRWFYEDFKVIFEYNHVIQAVANP